MTRLGHLLTILAAAFMPTAIGSAFAQPPTAETIAPPIDVQTPAVSVQIPRVDIPRVEIPQFELPFNYQFDMRDLSDQLDRLRMDADMAEIGRSAQKDLTTDQREQMEEMRQHLREAAEAQREAAREVEREARTRVLERFNFQGPPSPRGPTVRIFRADRRCNDRDADRLYDCGRDALDDKQWDRAVEYFGKVAESKSERADAALYWKAYAQNKLGQRTEALATIAQFKSAYAKSRWSNDVSALEIDVRQHSGQPVKPGETTDDDLKLLALQALMNNNSAEAVPMLEKILQGPQSPKLKDRALFVLAQNQTPAARAIVVKVAKGGANPDLQARAVRYLGEFNTPESRQALAEVYGTTTDPDVKRNILRSYMVARDRDHLLAAARQEQDASLRSEAIRQLGNMRADDALAELYAREKSADVKKQIIRSLGNTGNADKLMGLAQTEQDPELRRNAIRTLGQMRRQDTGPRLTAMYDKEQNADVRKAVIDALFIQGNAPALVELARKEKNSDLKLELVKRLTTMKDPEAQNYLMELLK